MTLFIERDYVTIKEMQSHLSNCYYGMFPRGYVAKMLALNGYIDPEFEDRLNDAAYKFHLEVSEIISDMLKIMDAKAIDRDTLYSNSENALVTVKFNLEK